MSSCARLAPLEQSPRFASRHAAVLIMQPAIAGAHTLGRHRAAGTWSLRSFRRVHITDGRHRDNLIGCMIRTSVVAGAEVTAVKVTGTEANGMSTLPSARTC